MTLKKIFTAISMSIVLLTSTLAFAQLETPSNTDTDFYYTMGQDNKTLETNENATDLGKIVKTDTVSTNDTPVKNGLLYQIRQYFMITGGDYEGKAPALAYVKMLINMALGLVSFISLILVLFAFYLILFDKGEEGIKKAKKILMGVAIALVLMGLSRIIVSSFFYIYSSEVGKTL